MPVASTSWRHGEIDPPDSRRRAVAAGIGLLVVVLTYDVNGFSDSSRWWAAAIAVVVAVLLADGLGDVRRLVRPPGLAPATIVAALAAMAACVPETDQMAIAALVPIAVVVAELVRRAPVGLEWYAVAAASAGWAGLYGATGRSSALAGALFAWWAVLLVPLVDRLRPLRSPGRALAVAVVGAAAAVVMARTGGVSDSGWTAAWATLASAVVSFAVGMVIAGRPAPAQPASSATS